MQFITPILLYLATSAIAKLVAGVALSVALYYTLKNTIMPKIEVLETKLLDSITELGGFGNTIGELVQFFDLLGLVNVLLSVSGAILSLKLYVIAIRGFGVNV